MDISRKDVVKALLLSLITFPLFLLFLLILFVAIYSIGGVVHG